jgi:hypothetical protein
MTDPTLAERLARCVKPLEWRDLGTGDHRHEAFSLGLHYEIFCAKDGWSFSERDDDEWSEPFPTLEAAQAAAQADYTAHILAALDMDALAQEVEAMVGEAVEADRAEFQCSECDLPSYLCEARCFVRNAIKVHGEEKTWESVKEYFPAIRAREGGKP